MRTIAIAAVVTFLGLATPASARREQLQEMNADVVCRDGKPVALRVLIERPGVYTFYLPPDVCARMEPAALAPAAPRPQRST